MLVRAELAEEGCMGALKPPHHRRWRNPARELVECDRRPMGDQFGAKPSFKHPKIHFVVPVFTGSSHINETMRPLL